MNPGEQEPLTAAANPEAETAILQALMLNNDLVDRVSPIIRPLDFYDPWTARVYDRILQLVADGKQANPVTLFPYFKDDFITRRAWNNPETGEFHPETQERVTAWLAELSGSSGAAVIGAMDFAEQIRDLSRRRQLHEIYKQASVDSLDTAEGTDPNRIIAEVDEALAPLSGLGEDMQTIGVGKAWDAAFVELEQTGSGTVEAPGIDIAQYTDWNDVVGRMEGGDLIYLGGRPSMGKSALAFGVAAGAAAGGHPTELIGIEMNRRQTMRRIIANQMFRKGVTSPYSALTSGKLTVEDYRAAGEAREALESWDLNLSTPDEMNVEDIAPFLRRRQRALAAKGKKMELVVLDYLGRLGTQKEFRSPNDRTTYISRTLKGVAKKLNIVLIVLVQLSRAVEQRDDKRPILADMRDSGSLEQDADVVVFVYRDEYYLQRQEPDKRDEKKWNAWQDEMLAAADRVEVYSAKRREGALTKRTGFFFTRQQALRPSGFYTSDLYRPDHQPGAFFETTAEQRG